MRSYSTMPSGKQTFVPLIWPLAAQVWFSIYIHRGANGGDGFASLSLSHSTTWELNNRNSDSVVATWLFTISISKQRTILNKYKYHP